jgi:uncharacterized protein (DUF885 family)
MTKQLLLLITMSLLFTTIAASQSDLETRRQKLRQLLSEEWEYQLRTFPELATQVGDHRYNDKLSDYSADAIAKHNAHEIDFVKRLEAIKTSDFPEQERLNQLLVARDIREDVDTAKFKNWEMPATQFFGPQHWFVQLATDAPFHTVKDYDDYLARLRQIPHAFDQVAANMRQGLRDHLMPPKYLLSRIQCRSFRTQSLPPIRNACTMPSPTPSRKQSCLLSLASLHSSKTTTLLTDARTSASGLSRTAKIVID